MITGKYWLASIAVAVTVGAAALVIGFPPLIPPTSHTATALGAQPTRDVNPSKLAPVPTPTTTPPAGKPVSPPTAPGAPSSKRVAVPVQPATPSVQLAPKAAGVAVAGQAPAPAPGVSVPVVDPPVVIVPPVVDPPIVDGPPPTPVECGPAVAYPSSQPWWSCVNGTWVPARAQDTADCVSIIIPGNAGVVCDHVSGRWAHEDTGHWLPEVLWP